MDKPESGQEFEFPTGIKFADMTPGQRGVFVAKIAACVLTFGYAFPHAQFE